MLGRLLRSLYQTSRARGPYDASACRSALVAGNLAGAIACYRSYLERRPGDIEARINLGVALFRAGDAPGALIEYEKAAAAEPGSADAWYNAGIVHHVGGRLDEAEKCYRRALEADTEHAEANREFGMMRLALGDFSAENWRRFSYRRKCQGFPHGALAPDISSWQGEPLAGKSVLVYGEQGLGDEILFASCYRDLVNVADRCIFVCDPRLVPLLSRSFGDATVVGFEDATQALRANCDHLVRAGDLPMMFRTSPGTFGRGPYLQASLEKRAIWKRRLSALGPGLKIGLSWRGGTERTGTRHRSVALPDLRPLLDVPNVHYVNLQYAESSSERRMCAESLHRELHHWDEAIDDYDETAALVSELDLTITVTTSVAHLAGALGQPTWIMANAAPRWCYLATGRTTPWYPASRIFRQNRAGDWRSVIQEVTDGVRKMASSPS